MPLIASGENQSYVIDGFGFGYSFYLPRDGYVLDDAFSAIEFVDSVQEATLILDGVVGASVSNGIFVDDGCAQNLIHVGQPGTVYGINGIGVQADDIRIENLGSILSNAGTQQGSGIAFETTAHRGSIFNSGEISGSHGVLSQAASLDIVNTGEIVGTIDGLDVLAGFVRLDNQGTISGATGVVSTVGMRIHNEGSISATGDTALSLGGASRIVNSGSIAGDVVLSSGADIVDTRHGSVSGSISCGLGDDIVLGSASGDDILGGGGADRLAGFDGDDTLAGGAGGDVLRGGSGADTFAYSAIGDSTVAAIGRDVIRDFRPAQDDEIDVSAISIKGASAFTFIGAAAFGHHAGELQATIVAGNTIVSGDVNGDGRADFAITLVGAPTLQAGDFVL